MTLGELILTLSIGAGMTLTFAVVFWAYKKYEAGL